MEERAKLKIKMFQVKDWNITDKKSKRNRSKSAKSSRSSKSFTYGKNTKRYKKDHDRKSRIRKSKSQRKKNDERSKMNRSSSVFHLTKESKKTKAYEYYGKLSEACNCPDPSKKKKAFDEEGLKTYKDKLGHNLSSIAPSNYKKGIIKNVMLKIRNDKWTDGISKFTDGFDLEKLFDSRYKSDLNNWRALEKNPDDKTACEWAKKNPALKRVMDMMIPSARDKVRETQSVTHGTSKKKAVYSEQCEDKKLAGMYQDAFDLIELYINREREMIKTEKIRNQ